MLAERPLVVWSDLTSLSALVQACLLNPHCLSITVWGFTDKYSWIPTWFTNPPEGDGLLWDANYQPKRTLRTVQYDLAAAGPPLVLPRVPQKPPALLMSTSNRG